MLICRIAGIFILMNFKPNYHNLLNSKSNLHSHHVDNTVRINDIYMEIISPGFIYLMASNCILNLKYRNKNIKYLVSWFSQ